MAELPVHLAKVLDSLERVSESQDSKNCSLSLRQLPKLRSKTDLPLISGLLNTLYSNEYPWAGDSTPTASYKSAEVELYLSILLIMHLTRESKLKESEQVIQAQLAKQHNRNSQPLLSKLYYYLGLVHELKSDLDVTVFLKYYRTSCLKHDTHSQSVLINIILRFYLLLDQIRLSKEFFEKTGFPESAGYPEIARNQFYLGKIKALTLNYNEAHNHLVQAARKAPENGAAGFKLTVEKLRILVELLMGTVPVRKSLLGVKGIAPYVDLIRAVQQGELESYESVLQRNKNTYIDDMNYSLVIRLRHIVIKSGLKRINLAYSVIFLGDVASKLGLKEDDTEFIVAKAIRDGVIEAYIDHENKVLRSKVLEDVYMTNEPQALLQKRIEFCIGLRNDTVKAMQFPQSKNNNEPKETNEEIDFDLLSEDDDF